MFSGFTLDDIIMDLLSDITEKMKSIKKGFSLNKGRYCLILSRISSALIIE